MGGMKLFLHVTLKVGPADIFPSADGVAADIRVVRHHLGQGSDILLGIGPYEGPHGGLRTLIVGGETHMGRCREEKRHAKEAGD